MVNLDAIFGMYQQTLAIREDKIGLISSNIANQDTPGYKAKDIGFKAAMSGFNNFSSDLPLKPNRTKSISANANGSPFQISYRSSVSPSVDGNTVDANVEKTAFMKNVVAYKSTLAFVRNREEMLMHSIKGE